MPINIAIDGTAGSGKGTLAKQLAKKLGFGCLDTGAIYRSVAYYMVENGVDLSKSKNIEKAIEKIDFKVVFENQNGNKVQKNILNGKDLGDKIRTEQISLASSIVSQVKQVREFATKIQHEIANSFDVVVEGRDIGTVVLPNANYKFFLTASPQVRARRRLKQLKLPEDNFESVLEEILERDRRDTTRALSPLKAAEDAVYIDNSNQLPEETLKEMLSHIK